VTTNLALVDSDRDPGGPAAHPLEKLASMVVVPPKARQECLVQAGNWLAAAGSDFRLTEPAGKARLPRKTPKPAMRGRTCLTTFDLCWLLPWVLSFLGNRNPFSESKPGIDLP
jgi:hypothetical protein